MSAVKLSTGVKNSDNQAITNIEDALYALGVRDNTLSAAEKKALDEQGYLILNGIIEKSQLKQWRETFDNLLAQDKIEMAGAYKARGTRHLSDLVNKTTMFDLVFTSPRLLAAVHQILGRDFRLVMPAGRDPHPGFGQQSLHADAANYSPYQPAWAVTSLWMIDDFTAENGATRLVPGSHKLPPNQLINPAATHPRQIQAVAPAGSVLVFNSFLWHSGMLNRSQVRRRALQVVYSPTDMGQYISSAYQRESGFDMHSPAAKYILGL